MKLLLTFSKKKNREPVIAQTVKETGVLISVERAHIDSTSGEVLIDVPNADAARVCELMQSKGVTVRILEHGITLNEEECVNCGACVSICPKEVFYMDSEFRLRLRDERCVLCGKCIPACPHRALSQTL
jgi:NAD-dependent dihydropyrimidine dehydrogenase PreA subunit